ncbi:MAG: RidA family protein [Phycisphaeraceae bacterium]|nr:RidA family protein [Phycisphaeraceae bacterium]
MSMRQDVGTGPNRRVLLSSGSSFEAEVGYSRAVVVGDRVEVAGTTGFDYRTMTIADSVVEQTRQCLMNIREALNAVGSSLEDVVRVRYILQDRNDFPLTWPVLREAFEHVRPAATMIQAGLSDPRMMIEIEVSAVTHSGGAPAEWRSL